jgi:hypothetical protein
MPVRRGSDVNNIDLRQGDQFPVVMKGLHAPANGAGYFVKVVFIDIADSYHPCAGIGDMAPAHAAYTDDAFGQLIAGGKVASA